VRVDCPQAEKEVTWVGGAVVDANGEPIMGGVVVRYFTLTNRDKNPWATNLEGTEDPWKYDLAKMDKNEWSDYWGAQWNFYFELFWWNLVMNSQDTYRDEVGVQWMHTTVEWWVWVESPSGEQLSEKANFKTYSHPVWQANNPVQKEPDPDGGPPQCFVVFQRR
jgi:hypothetical protein